MHGVIQALTLVVLFAVSWSAQVHAETTIDIEGLLVVTECRGASYKQISRNTKNQNMIEKAASCARMGAPVAILAGSVEGGRLYTLVSQSKALAEHIAKYTRVRGKEIAPGVVIPEKLEIRTDSGWVELATTSMM